MASKRERSAIESEAIPEPVTKRSKTSFRQKAGREHQNANTDPTWGQKYVFSGLDGTTVPEDPEIDAEDDKDAMEYLKAVR
jgi:hypothetical protein